MSYVVKPHASGFRRALIISAAIHLVLAAIVVIWATQSFVSPHSGQPGVDTSIRDASVNLEPEQSATIATPQPSRIEKAPALAPQESMPTGRQPTIASIPGPLPPEFLAIIRRSQQKTVASSPVGAQDANVKPAGATGSAATPLHGAMKPGQSVVYILDCSGSMGEFGKLGLARASLIATLHRQPDSLHFQVISYNSNARLLLSGGFATIAADLATAEARLAKLYAAGRSNHAEALRVAAGLRPDVIVWLTDADDLSAVKLKQVLGGAGKPIPVYVAEVSARGVGTPQELR